MEKEICTLVIIIPYMQDIVLYMYNSSSIVYCSWGKVMLIVLFMYLDVQVN